MDGGSQVPRWFLVKLWYVDICRTKKFRIESMNSAFSYLSISIFKGHKRTSSMKVRPSPYHTAASYGSFTQYIRDMERIFGGRVNIFSKIYICI